MKNAGSDPVIVVGGGITGAFASYFLARQFRKAGKAIMLIDPQEDDVSASHVNPGGLNPLHGPGIPGDMEAFFMHAFALHRQHWNEFQQHADIDFNGRLIKRIFLALTDEQKNPLLSHKKLYDRHPGFRAEWLEPAELRRRENAVSPKAIGGLYTFGNATVSPKHYTRAVSRTAVALGATLARDRVVTIDRQARRLALASGEILHFSRLVLCCGPDTALGEQVAYANPVKPMKGELLIAETDDKELEHDVSCGADGIYRFDGGKYWLGGTRSDTGFSRETTTGAKTHILEACRTMLPSINFRVEKQLAGLRPSTPDGRPIVGEIAEDVFIATGAGSKGMLLSAALGHSVAQMLGGEACPFAAALSPARFDRSRTVMKA